MPVYQTKDFISAVQRKGFRRDNTHHDMFWYYYKGKKTSVRTRTSKSESEYSDDIFDARRKQLGGLNKQQMKDFIACPLTAEEYSNLLVQSGKVIPPKDDKP